MEQVVSTILTSAEPGQTRAGVIYRVTDQADTVYASWTPAVYETARMYIGRPVLLTYDESQSADGRFTNRNLRLIEPADGQQAPLSPAQLPGPPGGIQEMIQQQLAPPAPPAPTVQPTQPLPQFTPPAPPPINYQNQKHPEEQQAIRRAVALQAAVNCIPALNKPVDPNFLIAIAEYFLEWLTTGEVSRRIEAPYVPEGQ